VSWRHRTPDTGGASGERRCGPRHRASPGARSAEPGSISCHVADKFCRATVGALKVVIRVTTSPRREAASLRVTGRAAQRSVDCGQPGRGDLRHEGAGM